MVYRRRQNDQDDAADRDRRKCKACNAAEIPGQAADDGYDHRATVADGEHCGGDAMHVVRRTVCSIDQFVLAFWELADALPPPGWNTDRRNRELPLRDPVSARLYGTHPAAGFPADSPFRRADAMSRPGEWTGEDGKPVKFKGWCRKLVNKQIYRIKRIFKWAASREMVPVATYNAIATIEGLQAFRSEARETARVLPAPPEMVEVVLPFLPKVIRQMVELEYVSGGAGRRTVPASRRGFGHAGRNWKFRPPQHKTLHRGEERIIEFGPKAIEILKTALKPNASAYLFSPADAEAERNASRRKSRITKRTPSQIARDVASEKRNRNRQPGEMYNKDSFNHAVHRACEKAFPPPNDLPAAELKAWKKKHRFTPHQLRHAAATRIRKSHGLEAAGVVLGHKTLAATMIYAEADQELAALVMGQIG